MLQDTITLIEGANIVNLTVASGTSDPGSASTGELFYRTDTSTLRVYNGSAWSDVSGGGGGTVTSVALSSSDLSVSGSPITSSGTITANLATQGGVTAAAYTNVSLTVNSKGIITAISSGTAPVTSVSGTSGRVTSSGGTTPAIDLATTAVSAGSYTYGAFTVDAYGRLTAASSGTAPVTSVTGTSGRVSSSGGTTPTVDLVATAVSAGSYTNTNLTVDAYGRITAASNGSAGGVSSFNTRTGAVTLTSGDVTTALTYTPVNKAGDSLTGSLTFDGTHTVTGLPSPSNSSDAASKAYVDAIAAGLTWKNAAVAATTANLTATYSGTPNFTLTNAGAQAALALDGVSLSVGNRVLVKNQSTQSQNGIYTVTTVGTGSTNWVLTRATDFDSITPIDEINGAAVYVQSGTLYGDTGWTQIDTVTTLDTSPIAWAQFSGAGSGVSSLTAGTGISVSAPSGAITLSNTGVTSATGTANQVTVSASTGAVTFSLPSTINVNTSGSAATLTTPRAINGVNFDGSAAITVTAAAGTLTGATLNSTVTASSLTSVGTLSGLSVTGTTTQTGSLNHAGASSPILLAGAAGTSGQVLTSAGAGATPTWTTISSSASLTATFVGYGNGSNVLTGTSDFTWDTSTKYLTLGTSTTGGSIWGAAGTGNAPTLAVRAGVAGTTSTNGGNLQLIAGDTVVTTGATGNGGNVQVQGGGSWAGSGGAVSVVGGSTITGTGGQVTIAGGFGLGGFSSVGGPVIVRGGEQSTTTGTTAIYGGGVTVRGGNGSASGTAVSGGDVTIAGGIATITGSGTGTTGSIIFQTAPTQSGAGTATLIQRLKIDPSGTWLLGASAVAGTSGQVLTSNGTGAAPTWTTVSAGSASTTGGAGALQFNNSGAFASDTGLTYVGSTTQTLTLGTTTTGATIQATTSSANGRTFNIFGSGPGTATSSGGDIHVTAGAGGATSGSGGYVYVNGGNPGGTASAGGNVSIQAGSSGSSGGSTGGALVLGGVVNSNATGNATLVFGPYSAGSSTGVTMGATAPSPGNASTYARTTAGVFIQGGMVQGTGQTAPAVVMTGGIAGGVSTTYTGTATTGGAVFIAGGQGQFTSGTLNSAAGIAGGTVTIQGGTGFGNAAATTAGNVVINGGTTDNTTSGTVTPGYIAFQTQNTTGTGVGTLTERFRILANGAWSVGSAGTNTGTSAQVLTSNGSGSAPTWQTVSAATVSTTGGTGAIQYNSGGVLTSDTGFIWTSGSTQLTLGTAAASPTLTAATGTTNGVSFSIIGSTGTSGTGGTLALQGGAGGSGVGGNVTLTGGNGSGANAGGNIILASGSTTTGQFGNIGFTTRSNATASSAAHAGFYNAVGDVTSTGLNAYLLISRSPTNSTFSSVSISAGINTTAGTTMNLTVSGGPGTTNGQAGGNVTVTGGQGGSGTGFAGGNATLQGGNGGGTTAAGGSVSVTGGAPTGTGTAGNINLSTYATASSSGKITCVDLQTSQTTFSIYRNPNTSSYTQLVFETGTQSGSATPLDMLLVGGRVSDGHNATITLTGGTTTGTGGNVSLTGGTATQNTFAGGNISITGGNGLTSGGGGSVTISTGVSPSGTAGTITFNTGTTASTARMTINPAGNVTVNAPASGVALTLTGASTSNVINVNTAAGATPIQVSDGTCTSWWFTNATNGIGFGTQTAHQTALYSNNASRLTISSAGNVAINAPTTGVPLTVNGAAATTTRMLAFAGTTTGAQFIEFANTSGQAWMGTEGSVSGALFSGAGTYSAVVGTQVAQSLWLGTNAAARVGINSAGNVTVNAPSSGNNLTMTSVASGSLFDLTALNAVMGNTNTAVAAGGYYRFQKSGTSLGYLGFGSSLFVGGTLNDFGLASEANLVFSTVGGAKRMVIDSNGGVTIAAPTSGIALSINSASSSGYLSDMNGGAAATTYETWRVASTVAGYIGTDGGAIIGGGTGTSFGFRSEVDAMIISGAGNHVMRYTTNGSVQIPAPAAANPALTVAGSAATTTSDLGTASGTITVDCTRSNVYTLILNGNMTTLTINNPQDGQTINLFITQDATGSRIATWPSSFKWPGAVAGVLSTSANSVDLLVAVYRSATGFWYANLMKAFG